MRLCLVSCTSIYPFAAKDAAVASILGPGFRGVFLHLLE